ncbi:MAG: ABC transporter permease [Turicibacter sp.]|uniref:Membrane protein n=1 Tax=Turicibacter faecis TaxID=2963365 RepID=A0ABN6Z9Q4_9FIRM|nr:MULTISPECIES: ABC transporter permease [unclassified Turicibacter]MCI8701693.1 ABC transporter permease [Turicibacter sp.]BEH90579.1 membrane protein [Turicibacter sp. TC023]MCI9350873.1 ABC transporter permease [Turicibacter sp.]MCU7205087.1 ABC transporter permease [Turicibacter sp. TA25]MCU7208356.1 ABC transporter permease [Turicibacter sp. 1E2]
MRHLNYAFKMLIKDKMLIFWTFAFPLILGTFFYLAFSNIENSEKLSIIPIAIVEDEELTKNSIFKTAFDTLSSPKSDHQLFQTRYTTAEEAKKLLEDNAIVGYLQLKEQEPQLTFNTNGIDETIFQFVTEEMNQRSQLISHLIEKKISEAPEIAPNPEEIYQDVINLVNENNVRVVDRSSEHLSYTQVEFYTLVAMTCLYGGTLSMISINRILANMSPQGKRTSISPVKKWRLIFSHLLASYFVQLLGLALLFAYTVFILKVDYGEHLPLIVLLAIIGSFCGLTLGMAVGVLFKVNENIKIGILISLTMLGCFLSGMMGITMKYVIDTHLPLLNQLNPASMITDGLYSLYYYETFDRYWANIFHLLMVSVVLIGISIFSLRGQTYDRI